MDASLAAIEDPAGHVLDRRDVLGADVSSASIQTAAAPAELYFARSSLRVDLPMPAQGEAHLRVERQVAFGNPAAQRIWKLRQRGPRWAVAGG
jgi:hypothetical protein